MTRLRVALLLAVPALAAAQHDSVGFDHRRHDKLFASCVTCHAGASTADAPLYPSPATCAACHDGVVAKLVAWAPPATPIRNNLRFEHLAHATHSAERAAQGGMRAPQHCISCHTPAGATWMTVRWAVSRQCLDCHGVSASHLAAPDTACATCHIPLARATRLRASDVARFQAPPSHKQPGFLNAQGHGAQAAVQSPVAASCATCHARDFCVQCHVDAPEQATIRALGADERSLALAARLTAPSSHSSPRFLTEHGRVARASPKQCSTCHTRESCQTCHATQTATLASLPLAGPGRAAGALTARRRPASHGATFVRNHSAAANAVPNGCAGCHVRSDCLECHRPSAAASPVAGAGYHPRDFLARHPSAAYARQSSCADCHNTAGFCATCHVGAGLSSTGPLRSGVYHDAKQFFLVGHGGAARQSLESCVSCHVERDCLTCHSALGGRRFNPHGPGFDAARLARKNPQMCTVCHGNSIPTR